MKQTFKILLSVLLIISMVFSSMILVNAQDSNENQENVINNEATETVFGDVDGDGIISIIDASVIQYHLAQLPPSERGKNIGEAMVIDFDIDTGYHQNIIIGDINLDSNINIVDVSLIQRHLASLDSSVEIERIGMKGYFMKEETEKARYYKNYFQSEDCKLFNKPGVGNNCWFSMTKDNARYEGSRVNNKVKDWYLLRKEKYDSNHNSIATAKIELITFNQKKNIELSYYCSNPVSLKPQEVGYFYKNSEDIQNLYKDIEAELSVLFKNFTNSVVKSCYLYTTQDKKTDVVVGVFEMEPKRYVSLLFEIDTTTKMITGIRYNIIGFGIDGFGNECIEWNYNVSIWSRPFALWYKNFIPSLNNEIELIPSNEFQITLKTGINEDNGESYKDDMDERIEYKPDSDWEKLTPTKIKDEFIMQIKKELEIEPIY